MSNYLEGQEQQEGEKKDSLQEKIESASGLVTQFTEFNGVIQVSQIDPETTTDKLPVGIYSLMFSMISGYYLEVEYQPKAPSKLYGNVEQRAELIINTYMDRDVSTGVLLIGKKGQGKTLLTSVITDKLLKAGVPVILVPAGYAGAGFNSFLGQLGNCCLIFDEFAKLYENKKERQDELLTLFDGTKSTKRLILLTENNEYNINDFLLGRPGRIFYKFKYGVLDLDIVEEVLVNNGIDEEVRVQIMHYATDIDDMSMDILKALIDEHKRYPEHDIKDIVERLNVNTTSERNNYTFEVEKFELTEAGKAAGVAYSDMSGRYFYVGTENTKQYYTKLYTSKLDEDGEKNEDYKADWEYKVTEHYDAYLELRKDKPKAIKDGKYLYSHAWFSVVGTWKEIKTVYSYGGFF